MDVVLASNMKLQTNLSMERPTPKIQMCLERSLVEYEYAWKVRCVPRVLLKSIKLTQSFIKELERIAG